MAARDLIRDVLLAPESITSLTPLDWDLLIRQGRRANLLARLAHVLNARGALDSVPSAPREHLVSAMRITERQTIAVRHEIACIANALEGSGVPLILLKGAAYVAADLPVSVGRIFSDIDIIVPRPLLGQAESALLQHGWRGSTLSPYDQRYYRRWMHELPPMRHFRRDTTIDVHHNILPETARLSADSHALLDNVVSVPGHDRVFVLQPVDMLLHSATHLFHEGEFISALRDLFDIDGLLRHFGSRPGFWDELVRRAAAVGLSRPLYYALRVSVDLLRTEVPKDVLATASIGRPAAPLAWTIERCFSLAFQPVHPSVDTAAVKAARFALYVRSHWLRMPMHLLVYHLGRKALLRTTSADTPVETARPA